MVRIFSAYTRFRINEEDKLIKHLTFLTAVMASIPGLHATPVTVAAASY